MCNSAYFPIVLLLSVGFSDTDFLAVHHLVGDLRRLAGGVHQVDVGNMDGV